MIKIIKTWFYYQFKEKNYIKKNIVFEDYYICKEIAENDILETKTKQEVCDYYGLQYNG